VILVDVREPEEFNKKHLPTAINIPRGILEMQMIGKYPNAERRLLFIALLVQGLF
jgi:rhodanese-related sulfurtransferase